MDVLSKSKRAEIPKKGKYYTSLGNGALLEKNAKHVKGAKYVKSNKNEKCTNRKTKK